MHLFQPQMPSHAFVSTTDARNDAIAAVLSQGPTGKDLPIAFVSNTLNNAENNYATV